jgi:carbonic anhydrase/acetyltransferase-like protein (isoleucine patch superfamily)
MPLLPYLGHTPRLAPDVFLAPDAYVVGNVTIGPRSSIWFGATLRGDHEPVKLGKAVNVQDHSVLHTDEGCPLVLGDYVSLGHNAVVHGAVVEDHALIAIGAIVLSGARIGAGSIIAANALVPEGREIPPRSLVVGTPGKVVREVTEAEYARILQTSDDYVNFAQQYLKMGVGSH